MPEKPEQNKEVFPETRITFTPEELIGNLNKVLDTDKQLNAAEREDIRSRIDELKKNMKKAEKGV